MHHYVTWRNFTDKIFCGYILIAVEDVLSKVLHKTISMTYDISQYFSVPLFPPAQCYIDPMNLVNICLMSLLCLSMFWMSFFLSLICGEPGEKFLFCRHLSLSLSCVESLLSLLCMNYCSIAIWWHLCTIAILPFLTTLMKLWLYFSINQEN